MDSFSGMRAIMFYNARKVDYEERWHARSGVTLHRIYLQRG